MGAGAPVAVPGLRTTADGLDVVWAPQPGSQERFLSCPLFEVLLHGNRGGGKTDGLLMAYAQHVGRGFGPDWRGAIFRRTYPELDEVRQKALRWFRAIFPGASFNIQKDTWTFAGGEQLLFRYVRKPEDYWNYHGHALPFLGFEELTTWADDVCYLRLFSCCRSSNPDVPRMVRATTNPFGVGHEWVKRRFKLEAAWRETKVVVDGVGPRGEREEPRAAIFSSLEENRVLLDADPGYRDRTLAAASSQGMADAWGEGSWNIVVGGMFTDVWQDAHSCLPTFDVPPSWAIDRAFDWGSSRPFSVGWWAESDGSDLRLRDGRVLATVRGDLFRVREWYGCTGRPNEGLRMLASDVAAGIVEREILWGWRGPGWCRVKPGPADSSIFTVENGSSIAGDMTGPVRIGSQVHQGVAWTRADKRPGSRKKGWERLRRYMRDAAPEEGRPRERPGLFVVEEHCGEFLRTVLSLVRDERDPDDVDTDAEDHAADEARYRVVAGTRGTGRGGSTSGWY